LKRSECSNPDHTEGTSLISTQPRALLVVEELEAEHRRLPPPLRNSMARNWKDWKPDAGSSGSRNWRNPSGDIESRTCRCARAEVLDDDHAPRCEIAFQGSLACSWDAARAVRR
jgi:hypothetical protein